MTTDLNEYLLRDRDMNDEFPLAARIVCADGFSLSVQANRGAYCSPRDNEGPWSAVEVGFPSGTPDVIMEYAERPEDPTGTVYGYVPIALVESLIAEHGGMQANAELSRVAAGEKHDD